MADFCTRCVWEIFVQPHERTPEVLENLTPDIDVFKIYGDLPRGMWRPCLCEGCGLGAIMKSETGELLVAYATKDPDHLSDWTDYGHRP